MLKQIQATIASGGSISGDLGYGEDFVPVAIIMPAAWTAADITFQSVDASGTARNMYTSANAELQFNVAASRHIIIDPANFKSAAVIRVRSGTSGVPVNQAADRIITLVCRDIESQS